MATKWDAADTSVSSLCEEEGRWQIEYSNGNSESLSVPRSRIDELFGPLSNPREVESCG